LTQSQAIAFHGSPVTWFGGNAVSEIIAHGSFEGNCLVVTDSNVSKTQHFMEFSHNLPKVLQSKIRIEFAILEPREPSSQALHNHLASFSDLDIANYIGYGGGSIMDSAKVFRAVKDSGYSLKELLNDPSKIKKKSGLMLIPTTAGTGSEMSPVAVFEHENEKIGLSSYGLRADMVAIEPRLSSTCPRETIEGSGIDAFAHALESTISNKANFFSSILSPVSLQLVYNALRRILGALAPSNENLTNLCKGIMLSSVSYGYAGCCGIHALAYPLSGKFHIRHGQAVALLLSPVLHYYFTIQPSIASFVRPLFGGKAVVSSRTKQDSEYVIEQVDELLSLSRTLPKKLRDLGVGMSDLPFLAKQSQKATRLLGNSPVPIGESEALSIYVQCL